MNYLVDGLIYTVEFRSRLGTWAPSSDDPTPVANDGEIEAGTVPHPPDVNGEESRFLRVRVTKQ